MLTQIVAAVLYAIIAVSVLFQAATAIRFVRRAALKRFVPAIIPMRVRRIRSREYRLALRAAKASVAGNS